MLLNDAGGTKRMKPQTAKNDKLLCLPLISSNKNRPAKHGLWKC